MRPEYRFFYSTIVSCAPVYRVSMYGDRKHFSSGLSIPKRLRCLVRQRVAQGRAVQLAGRLDVLYRDSGPSPAPGSPHAGRKHNRSVA
jgi:hypothetical protein